MSCDCCALALHYPDLTRKTYSTGCPYCAARYKSNGGETSIEQKWPLVDIARVRRLMAANELIDPELRKRKT